MDPADKPKAHPNSIKNLKPFSQGQSGNPAGKAPGTRSFKSVIRELLESPAFMSCVSNDTTKKLIEELEKTLKTKLSNRQLVVVRQILSAIDGDTQAFNALADREEGKPAQVQVVDTSITYIQYLEEVAKDEADDGSSGEDT